MSLSTRDYSFLGEGITADMEVKVFNNSGGRVSYNLSEPRVSREFFRPGHMISVTFDEIYALSNEPGGMDLLLHFLQIRDNKVREALALPTDPEYLYTTEDIKKLVLKGTKDQLLDALEFGPYGMAEVIRKTAVDEKLDSGTRIDLLSEVLGIDLKRIYENDKEDDVETEIKKSTGSKRRAQPITEEAPTPAKRGGRRAAPVAENTEE